MLIDFFLELRKARLPVSLKELLVLIEALREQVAFGSLDEFYCLARAALIKNEAHLDRFDRVFAAYYKGVETPDLDLARAIPEEWLRRQAELLLSREDQARIASLGGWEQLMQALRERLAEQRGRHQGGSKWIGTAGRSPFGAYGYHPEGVRIGQDGSRHRRAVKVWDRREFRNLDDTVELGTRNLKVALRRLRRFAREGAAETLDLDDTIRSTARNAGWLDLRLVPERHNAVKVLLFLDAGGSMDEHVRVCEELFSAARGEFKRLEHYYFHNFVYESVWRDNRRRFDERIALADVLRRHPHDCKLIVVGDATMSPYEILHPGGSVEHSNAEAGSVWLRRMLDAYPRAVWLNPQPRASWDHYPSVGLVRELMAGRMYPLTLAGLDAAVRELSR
jgi:uncharacterized protein with von Willebrand factor type A (vWA) domain